MEDINLCECLKDMPKGTKLYSLVHGKVSLSSIIEDAKDFPIEIKTDDTSSALCTKEGKYCPHAGECVLFPSKEMKDWTKFFKHGDIVASNNIIAIFDSWLDTSYTEFYAKYLAENAHIYKNELCNTKVFSKASKEQRDNFIKEIESQFKDKLNPETLEIEHENPKNTFSLKPFDKVLVRDSGSSEWQIDMFSLYKSGNRYPYICLADTWKKCIPYNKETAHLLGTKKDYKQLVDYGKDYSNK